MRPKNPSPPVKPEEFFRIPIASEINTDCSLIELAANCGLSIDKIDLSKIFFHIDIEGYSSYSYDTIRVIFGEELVKNPNYQKQLARFDIETKKYEEKLKQYEENMKIWESKEAERIEKQMKELQKTLKKIKR